MFFHEQTFICKKWTRSENWYKSYPVGMPVSVRQANFLPTGMSLYNVPLFPAIPRHDPLSKPFNSTGVASHAGTGRGVPGYDA